MGNSSFISEQGNGITAWRLLEENTCIRLNHISEIISKPYFTLIRTSHYFSWWLSLRQNVSRIWTCQPQVGSLQDIYNRTFNTSITTTSSISILARKASKTYITIKQWATTDWLIFLFKWLKRTLLFGKPKINSCSYSKGLKLKRKKNFKFQQNRHTQTHTI